MTEEKHGSDCWNGIKDKHRRTFGGNNLGDEWDMLDT